ncbi:SDR family NAD(P)-dependent oxidoreductase [Sphingomonas sp. KC8]|uniref:SDR family NAD(P)-dependent oxidoreductase n=1 Tax=Sphingomonas sp. KC8 TaxID=1030157 RepID=UPI000248A78D|nr:SDR family oxidoreductase [Sphingomonas sp. KC8]ARS26874.1 dehydrogenase [Sphingomonas sp. KC8]
MKVSLEGKVAIVTGSGANIGEACARMLAGAGASVVLADINIEGAQRVAEDIQAAGGQAFIHTLELTEEASVRALIGATGERFGRIDILHNNAADTRLEQMAADGSILEMDVAVWDRAFAVNTRGAMLMIKHAAPHMIAAGGGSIINTGSGVAILGDLFNPAYSTSKGAINTLTRNVAAQLGRHNIRCNAVLPGLVLSPLARTMMGSRQIDLVQRHVLLPRPSVPEDIAGVTLFLASDLGSFVTGQIISADGGIVHHTPYYADMIDAMAASEA